MVSTLATCARGSEFDPHSQKGKVSVCEHAYLSGLCMDDQGSYRQDCVKFKDFSRTSQDYPRVFKD